MSRKGCSPDNAACQGFFGQLKTELFYLWDWRAATVEQFVKEVDSYMRGHNKKRIGISLGALGRIEYRPGHGFATSNQSQVFIPQGSVRGAIP